MAIEVDIAQVRSTMGTLSNFAGFIAERVEMERRKHEYAETNSYTPSDMVWSEDPYLADKHFANVDRNLDATTDWLVWNYYTPNATNENLWMAPIIARYFNKPATINCIPLPEIYDDEGLRQHFIKPVAWIGHLCLNSAYSPFNHKAYMRWANASTMAEFKTLISAMITNRHRFKTMLTESHTVEAVIPILSLLPGIGTYIATEIAQDFKLLPFGHNFIDKDTFFTVSNAARSGLNLLLGRGLELAVPEPIKVMEVRRLTEEVKDKTGMMFTPWEVVRALGLYYQYYILMVGTGDSIRNYVPGRARDLKVPSTPETFLQ